MIQGTPKADGLAISRLTCEHGLGGWLMTAKIRLVDVANGNTHFSTETSNITLSKETKETFDKLVKLVEQDAAKYLFKDRAATAGEEEDGKGLDLSKQAGLSEHIGRESL